MVPEPIDRIMKQWMLLLSARVLRWSGGREALGVLFALALIGSAIVPLPIELALVVLVHAVPRRWIKFGSTMAAGSFIGGIVTYLLGYFLMGVIRQPLISFFAVHADWQRLWSIYQGGWGATVIAAVAFGGGPYKIVTMAAGATRMDFLLFALVLGLGRIGRFLLVAVLARRWNAQTASVLNHTFRVAAIVLVAVTLASAIGFAVLF